MAQNETSPDWGRGYVMKPEEQGGPSAEDLRILNDGAFSYALRYETDPRILWIFARWGNRTERLESDSTRKENDK